MGEEILQDIKQKMLKDKVAMLHRHIDSLRSFHFSLLAASIAQIVGIIQIERESCLLYLALFLHGTSIVYFALYYCLVYIREHWNIRSNKYYEAVVDQEKAVESGSKTIDKALLDLNLIFSKDVNGKTSIFIGLVLASIIPILFVIATACIMFHFLFSN